VLWASERELDFLCNNTTTQGTIVDGGGTPRTAAHVSAGEKQHHRLKTQNNTFTVNDCKSNFVAWPLLQHKISKNKLHNTQIKQLRKPIPPQYTIIFHVTFKYSVLCSLFVLVGKLNCKTTCNSFQSQPLYNTYLHCISMWTSNDNM